MLIWCAIPCAIGGLCYFYTPGGKKSSKKSSSSKTDAEKKVELMEKKMKQMKATTKALKEVTALYEEETANQLKLWDDIYGSMWNATDTELYEYLGNRTEAESKLVENGVLVYIYSSGCQFCKSLATQLLRHIEDQKPIDEEELYEKNVTVRSAVLREDMNETQRDMIYYNDRLNGKKIRDYKHQLAFNATKEEKFAQSLLFNVKIAAMDIENVSDEFRAKFNIDKYPTLMFFKSKDEVYQQDEDIPVLHEAVSRLQFWIRKLKYELDTEKPIETPKISFAEVEKYCKENELLNAGASAYALFSVSENLVPALRAYRQAAVDRDPLDDDKSLPDVKQIDWIDRYLAVVSDVTLPEDPDMSEFHFTRLVSEIKPARTESEDFPAPWGTDTSPETLYFASADEAVKSLYENHFKKLQYPSFSRIFPETLDLHLKVFPAFLVSNMPITDEKELAAIRECNSQFEYSMQFCWMHPFDAPSEAEKWFGFNNTSDNRERKVVLYGNKRKSLPYEGDLSDKAAVQAFVIETLTKWAS